jgi:transposase
MILAERSARLFAESKLESACVDLDEARAEAAKAQADRSNHEALIAYFKLEIEKLRRQIYGHRSERTARLLDQMELQLEGRSLCDRGRARGAASAVENDDPLFPT